MEAYDNNQVDGSQRGVSVIRYITIRSPLSNHLALTEALNATIGKLLDRLADRLEFSIGTRLAKLVDSMSRLNVSTRKTVSEVESIAQRMVDDPLTPKVRDGLAEKLSNTRLALDSESGFLTTWPQRVDPLRGNR